ncbi:MAG: PLP-dependent aminotransferase family protein [Caldimonas sp.]
MPESDHDEAIQPLMRSAQETSVVWARLFARAPADNTTLQARVRETVVHAILSGMVPPDAPLPPSRTLARMLGVSRNTVSFALDALVERGFLDARPRSGIYVNAGILEAGVRDAHPATVPMPGLRWERRLRLMPSQQRNVIKPFDWELSKYPYVYGQVDASLLPVADWRECEQQSLHVRAMRAWSRDHVDRDAEPLVDQIQQRLLPARGIWADRDQILVTAGAQMATYLLAQVLLDRRSAVGVEDPGYPDARNAFELRAGRVAALPIDAMGLRLGADLARCEYVYVTPSHQCPTTVTMPIERRRELLDVAERHDIVLIEDDHESELNFAARPLPALKSLDVRGRVVYMGSLSKTLSHGLRIGYVVAAPELIRELRALRRLVMRHPPANNAHAAARFIGQGYHDAYIRRLNGVLRSRRRALVDAVAEFMPACAIAEAVGGSAAWVQAPRGVDSDDLARHAAAVGVLIEPGGVFHAVPPKACRHFRLGYSAIPEAAIREGIRELAQVMR